ncbi:MAG TPA: NifB/NifX family molybdenum-iron cluster-binding protein [Clostridia bacterium]|nr:NifB/NifX family molybdenum-iron cluster-binding protein [Clostridia bacterium]
MASARGKLLLRCRRLKPGSRSQNATLRTPLQLQNATARDGVINLSPKIPCALSACFQRRAPFLAFGIEIATGNCVLIALPSCQGRVSPVFDVAASLLVVEFTTGKESKRRKVVLFATTPEGIVRNLRELRIDLLICGAISTRLQQALQQAGIRVMADICGEIEMVLTAYQAGRLNSPEFVTPGLAALAGCGMWRRENAPQTGLKVRNARCKA